MYHIRENSFQIHRGLKMCFKFFKCCKRKPVPPTPHNSAERIEVAIAKNTHPGHRYTDTIENIMDTLHTPIPTVRL